MVATLRHDIGLQGAELLNRTDEELWREFDPRDVQRWRGHLHGGHTPAVTFAVKLFAQVGPAVRLIRRCEMVGMTAEFDGANRLIRDYVGPFRTTLAVRSVLTLAEKLRKAVGLPPYMEDVAAEERGLVARLIDIPDPLDPWRVYADWLEENGDGFGLMRMHVIRGWLGKKAVKVKYGVPLIVVDYEQIEGVRTGKIHAHSDSYLSGLMETFEADWGFLPWPRPAARPSPARPSSSEFGPPWGVRT